MHFIHFIFITIIAQFYIFSCFHGGHFGFEAIGSEFKLCLFGFVTYSVKSNNLIRNGSIINGVIGIPVYTINTTYFTYFGPPSQFLRVQAQLNSNSDLRDKIPDPKKWYIACITQGYGMKIAKTIISSFRMGSQFKTTPKMTLKNSNPKFFHQMDPLR